MSGPIDLTAARKRRESSGYVTLLTQQGNESLDLKIKHIRERIAYLAERRGEADALVMRHRQTLAMLIKARGQTR